MRRACTTILICVAKKLRRYRTTDSYDIAFIIGLLFYYQFPDLFGSFRFVGVKLSISHQRRDQLKQRAHDLVGQLLVLDGFEGDPAAL